MWLCVLPRSAIGLLLLLLLLLLAPALTTAGVPLNPYNPLAKKAFFSYNSSSSTLETTLPLSDDADAGSIFVFALNAVPATGDLYFHMHTNVAHSWFGVGIGTDMPGAFMLVAYPSANSTGVTTSARIAEHGYSEPTFIGGAEIDGGLTLGPVEKIFNDEYAPAANTVGPQITISHCVCRGCARYAGDRLSFNNTAQPFFFALGPKNRKMADDSPYAGLRRHSFTGHFTMDMIAASTPSDFVDGATYGRVPAPDVDEQLSSAGHGVFATANASRIFDGQVDHDWRTSVHGITMGVGFLFVLPAGALLLKVVKSVLWHGIAQTVGVILVAVGFGAAVGLSKEFNRSRNFNSAHQILGFLLLAGLIIQFGLGLAQTTVHRGPRNVAATAATTTTTTTTTLITTRRTRVAYLHLLLGPALFLAAIINGGLGLALADDSWVYIPYAIAVLVVAIVYAGLRIWVGILKPLHDEAKREAQDAFDPYRWHPYDKFSELRGMGYGGYGPEMGEEGPGMAFVVGNDEDEDPREIMAAAAYAQGMTPAEYQEHLKAAAAEAGMSPEAYENEMAAAYRLGVTVEELRRGVGEDGVTPISAADTVVGSAVEAKDKELEWGGAGLILDRNPPHPPPKKGNEVRVEVRRV